MSQPLTSGTRRLPDSRPGPPVLLPAMLLKRGRLLVPGADGPVPLLQGDGAPWDPFDVVDLLVKEFATLYIVDLDGIEHGNPQLDYLQEMTRDADVWVDAGVRRSEQAIDVLVAGAARAVLSSAHLAGPRELKRAWRLSTELVFEVETVNGQVSLAPEASWGTADAAEIARTARDVGFQDVILSPREADPEWALVEVLARDGPTWINGTFDRSDAPRLASAHAAGGIFYWTGTPPGPSEPDALGPAR